MYDVVGYCNVGGSLVVCSCFDIDCIIIGFNIVVGNYDVFVVCYVNFIIVGAVEIVY